MAHEQSISKCIQLIQDLGSEASEHDKMVCLSDLRSESAQWPRNARKNSKQIQKLVSAGNYAAAIKLLELLRPQLAKSTLAASYRIAAGVAASVAFFFAIFAPMTLEEPNFLTPLASKAAQCEVNESFVAVGSDYTGTPLENAEGANVSGTEYSFQCCPPSGALSCGECVLTRHGVRHVVLVVSVVRLPVFRLCVHTPKAGPDCPPSFRSAGRLHAVSRELVIMFSSS